MEFHILSLVIDFLFLLITFQILRFIYKNFFRKPHDLMERYGINSYALITGATDGIGRAFCEEFARRGMNIVLVGRNCEKLKNVENEIKSKFPTIKTECVVFDFEKLTKTEDYLETFPPLLSRLDISILVNNVGLAYNRYFKDTDIYDNQKIITINCLSQTLLTQIFLEKFLKRDNRSALINVASLLALMPFPKFALYTASKVFSYYLTQAVRREYEDSKIDFMSLKPGYVATNLSQRKADGFYVISAHQCARGALNDLGYEDETFGNWSHKLQGNVLSWIPIFILRRLTAWGTSIKNDKLD